MGASRRKWRGSRANPALSGTYRLAASTPNSRLDTVLGVYSSAGGRLAYNDDVSGSNRDSDLTVTLTAGSRYFFGITNYTGTSGGSYTWLVDGPTAATPGDDAYENNDTFNTASNLGTLTSQRVVSGLVLADAADYFRFTTSGTGSATSAAYESRTVEKRNAAASLCEMRHPSMSICP